MPALSDRLPSLVVRYFRLFWGYAGARILVTIGLTFLMTYAEAIGIAMFYPLFGAAHDQSGMSNTITRVLDVLHVSHSPAGVLPLIVLLFLIKGVLQYATFIYQFSLSRHVTQTLRRRALDAIANADYQHVAGQSAGFYTNLLITEVNRASGGFLYYVRSLSPLLSAGLLFLTVCFLDWRLSFACVGMGAVMIGLTRLTGFVIRRYSLVVTKESSRLTGLLIQMFHGFKYLRATGAYRRYDDRVSATSNRLLEADFRAGAANAALSALSQPIMVLFLAAILYYRAVIQGGELASMFVLLMYFFRVMNEIFALQSSWQSFCGYVGSVDLVRTATEETEQMAERVGTEPFAGLRDAIILDHVDFSYKTGKPVLDDVSLRITAHTTVAVVGGSGAGKSTLVDLLTGTLQPSRGKVLFDGHDLAKVDLATLRSHVGYVPQDAVLFDDTVSANITLWNDGATADQIRDAARRARCLEFIEAMPQGFDTPIGDRGVKLSGGQRQRLAIARELLRSPEILVLDEATSALDTESELAIQQSIDQLKGQITIVIIAHRLSTIRNCDRVFVLGGGKIMEDGGFDELATRSGGIFRKMCELQEIAP
jgi:subfamily B ATP-binding cassette protein MsbA